MNSDWGGRGVKTLQRFVGVVLTYIGVAMLPVTEVDNWVPRTVYGVVLITGITLMIKGNEVETGD